MAPFWGQSSVLALYTRLHYASMQAVINSRAINSVCRRHFHDDVTLRSLSTYLPTFFWLRPQEEDGGRGDSSRSGGVRERERL